MVRTIAALLLGLVVALATMLLVEYLGMSLFPLPPGVHFDSEEDLGRLVAESTTGKKLWVLMGWALASFAGAAAAARTSRRHATGAALCVGAMIVLGVLLNSAMLPHPAWMTVAGVLLPVPIAWLAAHLATRRAPAPPA